MNSRDIFVPREQSSKLKQLGFNEMVVAKYQKLSEGANYQLQLLGKERNCNTLDTAISAPTWCQVFDWFREKHGFDLFIKPMSFVGFTQYYDIELQHPKYCWDKPPKVTGNTYEEARLACLEKLIELCTKK